MLEEITTSNKKSSIRPVEAALLFITGFFGLSALSSRITGLLGIPYFIEIYFVPIALYYLVRFSRKTLKNHEVEHGQWNGFLLLMLLMAFLSLSTIIGIVNMGDVYNVVTCIRPFVYLLLAAFIFSRERVKVDIYIVYIVVSGTLCGEVAAKIIFRSIEDITFLNTSALAAFVLIPFVKRNKALIVASLCFGLAVATMTLYRRILLTYLLAAVSGLLFFFSRQKFGRKVLGLIFLLLIGYFVYVNYTDLMQWLIDFLGIDNSGDYYLSASWRLVEGIASDRAHSEQITEIFSTFSQSILPQGPVGKLQNFGYYSDTSYKFLYDTFGSVLAWILVIACMGRAALCFIRTFTIAKLDEEYLLSGLYVPVVCEFLIFDGTFCTFANASLVAGFLVSGWFRAPRIINEEN